MRGPSQGLDLSPGSTRDPLGKISSCPKYLLAEICTVLFQSSFHSFPQFLEQLWGSLFAASREECSHWILPLKTQALGGEPSVACLVPVAFRPPVSEDFVRSFEASGPRLLFGVRLLQSGWPGPSADLLYLALAWWRAPRLL